MRSSLAGCFTALVTPFKNGAVDEAALRATLRRQLDGGIDGLVPCGTTGETPTLTEAEWEQVIALTVDEASGRVPVVAGCGTYSTADTIHKARRAEALGADALLVVAPYYNKPTQEGLFQHFRAVADAVHVPLCVYNIPGRSGVRIETSTFTRLAEIPNITSVKEATADLTYGSELAHATRGQLTLLSGDDFTTLPFLAIGGQGVISVVSNVDPHRMSQLVRVARAGDLTTARDLHYQLFPLIRALFTETNPIPVKAALAMMGLMDEEIRLPMTPLSDAHRPRLRAELARLGLLPASQA